LKKKGSIKNKGTVSEKKKRASKILSILQDEYPKAKCHLDFDGPFELLKIGRASCRERVWLKV
jgi:hypothetical protein